MVVEHFQQLLKVARYPAREDKHSGSAYWYRWQVA